MQDSSWQHWGCIGRVSELLGQILHYLQSLMLLQCGLPQQLGNLQSILTVKLHVQVLQAPKLTYLKYYGSPLLLKPSSALQWLQWYEQAESSSESLSALRNLTGLTSLGLYCHTPESPLTTPLAVHLSSLQNLREVCLRGFLEDNQYILSAFTGLQR